MGFWVPNGCAIALANVGDLAKSSGRPHGLGLGLGYFVEFLCFGGPSKTDSLSWLI